MWAASVSSRLTRLYLSLEDGCELRNLFVDQSDGMDGRTAAHCPVMVLYVSGGTGGEKCPATSSFHSTLNLCGACAALLRATPMAPTYSACVARSLLCSKCSIGAPFVRPWRSSASVDARQKT